jgi:hypothetical protein
MRKIRTLLTLATKKYFITNYGCAAALTILLIIITQIPYITYFYLFLILAGLLIHYYLTTLFRLTLTSFSFIINFILWSVEQINIESVFHDTSLYQSDNYKFFVVMLGTFLWATNKIIIDFFFILFRSEPKSKTNLELIIK